MIPFHIFVYEKTFDGYDADEQKLSELTLVYEEIVEKLNAYVAKQIIDEYTKITIIDMSKKVLEHLAKKYSNVREGVGAVMGGKILEYEAKDILNKGRVEGEMNRLINQVRKKLEKNMSANEIAEALEEEISIIEKVIAELQKE